MKNTIVICAYLLLLATNFPRDEVIPCDPAPSNDKEAMITELLCIENYNKNLVLQRNGYGGLLRRINGQDGSDCLAIRCINTTELSIEVTYTPADKRIKVIWGGGGIDYVQQSGTAKKLSFNGIIGSMPRDAIPTSCQDKNMSYLQLQNNSGQEITVNSIKLELRYHGNKYKVVFEDKETRQLTNGDSIEFKQSDILGNKAFITASEGSCLD